MGDVIRFRGVSFFLGPDSIPQQLTLTPALQTQYELRSLRRESTKRDTKRIGDISEAHVIAAFTELGYHVLLPLGENHRYDLVVDDGNRLLRVQVKTGRMRNGVIVYNCSSSHGHRGGTARPYFGEIDYLAVYCPGTEKVYLLPEKELTATTAHLRVLPTRNNMKKTIRWASDFELA